MISNVELADWERAAASSESHENAVIRKLVSEVRRLKHEADDPNYLYCGSRIHRQAILVRNSEIDALRAQVAELRARADAGSRESSALRWAKELPE